VKIDQIETTKLEMPYTKPLVTATNNFTVARAPISRFELSAAIERLERFERKLTAKNQLRESKN
jgi:hypothetical protein